MNPPDRAGDKKRSLEFYHGTSLDRADSIQATGLKSNMFGVVHLTSDPMMAADYADRAAARDYSNPALVRIRFGPKYAENHLDDGAFGVGEGHARHRGSVRARNIHSVEEIYGDEDWYKHNEPS